MAFLQQRHSISLLTGRLVLTPGGRAHEWAAQAVVSSRTAGGVVIILGAVRRSSPFGSGVRLAPQNPAQGLTARSIGRNICVGPLGTSQREG